MSSRSRRRTGRLLSVIGLAVALATIGAGCSSSGPSTAGGSPTTARLPATTATTQPKSSLQHPRVEKMRGDGTGRDRVYLSGPYEVTYSFKEFCDYRPSANRRELHDALGGRRVGPTSGRFRFVAEDGWYEVRVQADPESGVNDDDCAWTYQFSPE